MCRAKYAIVFTAILALSWCTLAFSQVLKGSISGTITDPQGAVIAGAEVKATSSATDTPFTTTSDNTGLFRLNLIPAGEYTLEISSSGFQTAVQNNVAVVAGSDTGMGKVKLAVGQSSTTVEITAEVPLVETSEAQVTNTFTGVQLHSFAGIQENEGLDSLALFVPGVVPSRDNNFSNSNGGTGFSVNGLRGRNNDQQIDGQNNNDNSVAGPSLFVSDPEFVQQYVLVTDQFGPEYGRNAGSVVNIITKSGTNNWHGSIYANENNTVLNSLTNFQKRFQGLTSIPRANDEFGGFTVGGPIVKNKLFFFGGFDQEIVSQDTLYSSQLLTPTPAGLTTLTNCLPSSASVAALSKFGPYSISTGNPTPDPATLSTLAITGCPNPVQVAGLSRELPTNSHVFNWIGRSDLQLNHDTVAGRYLFSRNNLFNQEGAPGDGATGDVVNIPALSQAVLLSWTHNINPHMVNELRAGFNRLNVQFGGNSIGNPSVPSADQLSTALTRVSFSNPALLGFGPQSTLPQGRIVNTWQGQDNWIYTMGRHQLKAGVNYTYQRSPNTFLPNINGSYRFADWNGFAANTPNRVQIAQGQSSLDFREHDTFLYAGDDWKATNSLTLNLGLTWSYYGQPANLFNTLTTQSETSANPLFNPALPLSVRTFPELPSVKTSFGPSFGFAYSPGWGGALTGNGKTVIRGGYRLLYDPPFYNIYLNIASSSPVVFLQTFGAATSPSASALPLPAEPTGPNVRASLAPFLTPGVFDPRSFNQTTVSPNFGPDRVHTWSLGIQRELSKNSALEARYAGNHATALFQSINGNPDITTLSTLTPGLLPSGATPCTTPGVVLGPGQSVNPALGRINCNEGIVRERNNGGFSNYNALQVEYRATNLLHQLDLRTSYTYSRTLDNVSEIFSSLGGGNSLAFAQNPLNPGSGEYSFSGLDYPHQWSMLFTERLPFFKDQHGAMGHLLGGWSFSGNYIWASGQRYTPIQALEEALLTASGNPYDAAFVNAFVGTDIARPFVGNLGAPANTVGIFAGDACTVFSAGCSLAATQLISLNALNSSGSVVTTSTGNVRYIINAASAQSVFGTPFGARRNLSQDAATNMANFSLFKNIKFNERNSFEIHATFLNAFNHANFQSVDPFLEDAGLALQGTGFGDPSVTNDVVGNALGNRRIIFGGTFRF